MSYVGVKNFAYAILNKDDSTGVTYGDFVAVPGINKVEVKPNSSSASNYGDDVPLETAVSLGDIDVSLDLVDIPAKDVAALLGHTVKDGVTTYAGDDAAPYVAIRFQGTKGDGTDKYIKILKVKFQEPTDTLATKENSAKFQNPKIAGKATARIYDREWKRTLDGDGAEEATITAFLATVEPVASSSSSSKSGTTTTSGS